MRLGLFDHFGWAVAVTATADHTVVDRRRIELVEDGVTPAPFHYDSPGLDVAATTALVKKVRASISRAAAKSLDALPTPIESISLRALPANFPTDIETLMRTPYESRADAVMYRESLVELAHERGWTVHFYDQKAVLALATSMLGDRADEILNGPRRTLGAPWTKDHRVALAATIIA